MKQNNESGNKISVSISVELLEKIDAIAERENRSRSNMIAILLKEEMATYKPRGDTTPED